MHHVTSWFKRQQDQVNMCQLIKWLAHKSASLPSSKAAHKTTFFGSNNFCGSLLKTLLCSPPLNTVIRWHSASKNSIWKVCSKTWSANPTISCRQWSVCKQCLHPTLWTQQATDQILWCQCSLPKWHFWTYNSWPTGAGMEVITPCQKDVTKSNSPCTLAICIEECCVPAQQPSHSKWQQVMPWNLSWHQCWHEIKRYTHFWLPYVCTTKCPTRWQCNTQVEPMLQIGINLGPLPFHACIYT